MVTPKLRATDRLSNAQLTLVGWCSYGNMLSGSIRILTIQGKSYLPYTIFIGHFLTDASDASSTFKGFALETLRNMQAGWLRKSMPAALKVTLRSSQEAGSSSIVHAIAPYWIRELKPRQSGCSQCSLFTLVFLIYLYIFILCSLAVRSRTSFKWHRGEAATPCPLWSKGAWENHELNSRPHHGVAAVAWFFTKQQSPCLRRSLRAKPWVLSVRPWSPAPRWRQSKLSSLTWHTASSLLMS